VQYTKALRMCLETLRGDPGKFYGPANNLPLGAGLILRDCVLALPDIESIRYQTATGLAVILTHECDIDQSNNRNFNDLILVCPIIPLDDFCLECENEDGTGSWGGILPEIVKNNVYRAMYLPPVTQAFNCPEMVGGGIIYLNHISSCRVNWISNLSQQAICSLSAPGLLALDTKIQNHLLRPKAASLSFSR